MDLPSMAQDVLVEADISLREALRRLCASAKQILIVVEGERFCGTLSDGDVRRYLLKGHDLDDPIRGAVNFHPKFLFVTERERAKSFIWENRINAVPIVDEDMNLADIVFLHDTVMCLDEVEIRELVPDDLEMVMEFFDQMAGDTRAMFNRNDVNRIRVLRHLKRETPRDGEIHFAAVVRDSAGAEKMVGYVFLWDVQTKLPWLGIAVHEDWKGRHLGRRLLDHVDAWAKPKGYGGLMLTSVPANVRAHSLYARMGFEYFGVYPDSEFLYIKRYGV